MFSPYYAWARRRGAGEPLNHCALNVALYGRGGKRWALTERGRDAVHRERAALTIGPSSLAWDGAALTFRIDEVTAPLPSRIRGLVRLHPAAITDRSITLDAEGRHRWWPIAPCARVEIELERPALRWAGPGYLDSNAGDGPLEDTFTSWDWSRASLPHGTVVLYDVRHRDGGSLAVALAFDRRGSVEHVVPPPLVRLPRSRWGVARSSRADAGHPVAVLRTLEDTPFYARSLLATRLLGEPAVAMHESLSLDRFAAGWVQMLLPFRVPRALR